VHSVDSNNYSADEAEIQRGERMSKKTWMPLLIAAGVALSALPLTASAQSKQGYWIQPSTDLV
jgi:hypothetical protein